MQELAIKENQPLGALTTIGIGGQARYFLEVSTVEQLKEALTWAGSEGQPALVLGGGSNMVVSDAGWPGLVIKMAIAGVEVQQAADGKVRLISGGGVNWDDLVRQSVEENLQGIECLSGIPGTVGASPIQNIGAYGQEVRETIAWVEALNRESGEVHRFTNAECGFGYRWSRFKGEDRDRYVVTRVAFDLTPGGAAAVRYGDLTRYFDSHGITEPALADVRNAVLAVRGSKGMVFDPDCPDSRSCGSFFMNPIVTDEQASMVKLILQKECPDPAERCMPEYPAGEGKVKLSAAWLMEKSGIEKGSAFGGVGISSRHVLALINRGEGTSAELLKLVKHVQATVKDFFGIELHPEPVFVGFDTPASGRASSGDKA